MEPFTQRRKIEPPTLRAANAMDLAHITGDLRRGLKIRQADLARRAGVSRQWIVAMEQGKPTLEIGLVFRMLDVLGLELTLKPYDPPPAWITKALRDAQQKRYEIQCRRRAKRKTKREAERLRRIAANAPKGWVELE